jgi:hypothetical protein
MIVFHPSAAATALIGRGKAIDSGEPVVNVKLFSYFLVIDERYPNVIKVYSRSFQAGADDSYYFGRG